MKAKLMKVVTALATGSAVWLSAAAGPSGAAESPETTQGDRWAVVAANGSLVRGKGVVSSQNLDPGQYEVIFDRNVTQCARIGGISHPETGPAQIGMIGVAGRTGRPRGIFVLTTNRNGQLANRAFNLSVSCE